MNETQFLVALQLLGVQLYGSEVAASCGTSWECLPVSRKPAALQAALAAIVRFKVVPAALALGRFPPLAFSPPYIICLCSFVDPVELVPWPLIHLRQSVEVMTAPSSTVAARMQSRSGLLVSLFQRYVAAETNLDMTQGGALLLSYNGLSQFMHDLRIAPTLIAEPYIFALYEEVISGAEALLCATEIIDLSIGIDAVKSSYPRFTRGELSKLDIVSFVLLLVALSIKVDYIILNIHSLSN